MSPTRGMIPFSEEQVQEICTRAYVAEYHPTDNPLHQGNPLIEALAPPLSVRELIRQLRGRPPFDPKCRELPAHVRLDLLANVAHVFQPLNIHVQYYWSYVRAIRNGYVGRDIFDIRSVARTRETIEPMLGREIYTMARGFDVIGATGVGKTVSTERILGLQPPLICHKEYQGRPLQIVQVPWLRLETPHDRSVKGIATEFFAAIDSLLGTSYFREYARYGDASTNRMLTYMAFLCDLVKLGLLVVDEIQRLSVKKSHGTDAILNFLTALSNKIKVPIVLVGTFEAMELFRPKAQNLRRGTQQGNIIWERLSREDKSWTQLLRALWSYQYVRSPALLTPELSDALYARSGGITDFAVSAFMLAQERVIGRENEVITPEIIHSIGADRMQLASSVLDAIRRSDPGELQQYPDVYLPRELRDGYLSQQSAAKNSETSQLPDQEQGLADEAVAEQVPTAPKVSPPVPSPMIVPSDEDLRHSLVEGDAASTHSRLETANHIGTVDDYVPKTKRSNGDAAGR